MSQIILDNHYKIIQSTLVEGDAKNVSLTKLSFDWTELAGLSWIFREHSFDDYA